uniref:F-box domain-containing protein n=1 Tax=Megaselia scalaris TaxID=36166 RepID=T1GK37_MEGSC
MLLETLNEYIICEILKYLDYEDLSNLREISEDFYDIGKDVFVVVKPNGNFKISLDTGKKTDSNTMSIFKTVFQNDVFKENVERLSIMGLNKGSEILHLLEKFPNFTDLEICFKGNYKEDDDQTDYSVFPKIRNLSIHTYVPYNLALSFTAIEKLEFCNSYSEFLIRQNSETLEEIIINHLKVTGPVYHQDIVDMDFQIKSKLKVFTAIGVRCLLTEEFLKNQPDCEVNYVMCFSVNGSDRF